jgi:hypothetical protein
MGQRSEKKKPGVGVKRREMGIYETERRVLNNIERINKHQIRTSENIQGTYVIVYIMKMQAK